MSIGFVTLAKGLARKTMGIIPGELDRLSDVQSAGSNGIVIHLRSSFEEIDNAQGLLPKVL